MSTSSTDDTQEPGGGSPPTSQERSISGIASSFFTTISTPDFFPPEEPHQAGGDPLRNASRTISGLASDIPPEPESTEEGSGQESGAGAEAAKYRRRLRDAEAQRDVLQQRLAAVQRAQAEVAITALGVHASAVWATGTQLSDLLNDDGAVDPEKVQTAVTAAREQFGIEPAKPRGMNGLKSGASAQRPPVNKWRDAFAPDSGRFPNE